MYHRAFRAEIAAVRPALIELRGRFRELVAEDAIARLELALAEVLNNICEHGRLDFDGGEGPEDRPLRKDVAGLAPPLLPRHDSPNVHICIVWQESGLACAVTDDGAPLPEHCLLPLGTPTFSSFEARRGDREDLPEGGFGWYLIQDLTRAICYYREEQRNFLAFTIPFADTDPDGQRGDSCEANGMMSGLTTREAKPQGGSGSDTQPGHRSDEGFEISSD